MCIATIARLREFSTMMSTVDPEKVNLDACAKSNNTSGHDYSNSVT